MLDENRRFDFCLILFFFLLKDRFRQRIINIGRDIIQRVCAGWIFEKYPTNTLQCTYCIRVHVDMLS